MKRQEPAVLTDLKRQYIASALTQTCLSSADGSSELIVTLEDLRG